MPLDFGSKYVLLFFFLLNEKHTFQGVKQVGLSSDTFVSTAHALSKYTYSQKKLLQSSGMLF